MIINAIYPVLMELLRIEVIMIIYVRMARDYISIKEATKRTYQYLIAGTFMAGVLLFMLFNMKMCALTTFLEILTGSIVYFAILFLFKNELIMEGIKIVKKKFKKA
jgi:hypothetical protein